MSRLDDKTLALLSGYAAGVLSSEEHAALMEAALRDQEVFDALADGEALRRLLADDGAKSRLLAVLESPRATPWYRRPWTWAAAAVPALAGLFLLVFLPPRNPEPRLVAEARPNEAAQILEAPAAPPVPAAKTIKADAPAPAGLKRTSASAPPVPPPHASSESPVPGLAGAAAPTQEQSRELKEMVFATPITAPSPAPTLPPSAVQETKKLADAPTAALQGSSFRQEGGLAPDVKQKADALLAAARQKNEAPASRDEQSEILKVEFLTRRSTDAAWTPVREDRVAVGDPLRLRITTTAAGELRVRPGDRTLSLRTAVAPIDVDLGALPAGAQTITVSFAPAPAGRAVAREMGPSRSAMTMSPAMAAGEPVTVVRRILVTPR